MSPSRILCPLLFGACVLATGSSALASNSVRTRTAPIFDSRTCLLEVDLEQDASLRFSYDLPYEDTALTKDELPDSRTLRFALLSQPVDAASSLPNWLNSDDVERALEAGLIEGPPSAQDIASESSLWSGRITELRSTPRTLSCDEQRTVEVDASDVPAGVYELWAYTFEPPLNLWTHHPGLVVIANGRPTAPGAAIHTVTPLLRSGSAPTVSMRGCGVPGTVVSVSWIDSAAADFEDPAAWTPLAETVLTNASLQLDAVLPAEVQGRGMVFRVDLERDGEFRAGGMRGPVSFSEGSNGITPHSFEGACGPVQDTPVTAPGQGCSVSPSRPSFFAFLGLVLLPIIRKTRARRSFSPHKSSLRS